MPRTNPEIFLWFFIGKTPRDLIAKGVPKWRVYNYYRRWNREVKPAFEKLIK